MEKAQYSTNGTGPIRHPYKKKHSKPLPHPIHEN